VAEITRENFDGHWLRQRRGRKAAKASKTPKFKAVSFEESEGIRDEVHNPLLLAVYDHHVHPDRVASKLRRLGYDEAAKALLENLPKADATRKGNFGEVVASEHLRQRHGFDMPVFKLRYADNPHMPLRGEDLVAFEMDPKKGIAALCIGEAKVRTTNSAAAVREAHERLSDAYHPYPVALSLIASVLHDQGAHGLADQVDELMEMVADGRFPRSNWIFVITENRPKDAFEVLVDEEETFENLICVHVQLDGLGGLVTSLFESPLPKTDADK
jgi:hypothetical protein